MLLKVLNHRAAQSLAVQAELARLRAENERPKAA